MGILEKDSYPNSPVVEVAWEIRFKNSNQLQLEKIDNEFIPKLIPDYPEIKPLREAGFRVTDPLSQDASIKQFPSRIMGYELMDLDHKNIVRITTWNLVVITRQHTNFGDFYRSIISITKTLFETFVTLSNSDIFRVGLRYVNVCELPENNKNLIRKYILLPINDNRFSGDSIAAFRYETLQHIEKWSLRSVFYSAVVESVPKVVIDLDSFLTNIDQLKKTETLKDYILKQTDEMHKLIKKIFQDSITEAFVNEVMERER